MDLGIKPSLENLKIEVIEYEFPDTKAGSYNMLKCRSCGFLRIDPVPSQKVLNSLYMENNFSGKQLEHEVFSSPFLTSLKKNIVVKPLINRLKNYFKDIENPTLLDIGCSTGWITSNSRDAGFNVLGLEANRTAAEFGRNKYGLEILEGYIEDLDLNMKFNSVTMFHVLEHLTDPIVTLKKVNNHLKDNGKILIVVPNADSLGVKIFGRNYNWNIPDHISFFSPVTVSDMLNKAGFRVLSISHLTSPPLLFYSFHEYMDKRNREGRSSLKISNPILANLLFMPLALLGKIAGRGEVIAVYAECC